VQVIQKKKTDHACHLFFMTALQSDPKLSVCKPAAFPLPGADVVCAKGGIEEGAEPQSHYVCSTFESLHVFDIIVKHVVCMATTAASNSPLDGYQVE
jgi:hypothetical protein